MSKKVALHNLGCKVNAYEVEAMQQLLEKAGYEIVPFEEGADIYLINTCTVTNIADRKSRQMLHRARKMNPNAVVVAAGCYVQAQGAKADDCIDIIIGNNKKKDLIAILDEHFAKIEEKEDGLIIEGVESLKGGVDVWSWKDHRIAMTLAIAATRCEEPIILKDYECISKSYPSFFDDYRRLGGIASEWNVGK